MLGLARPQVDVAKAAAGGGQIDGSPQRRIRRRRSYLLGEVRSVFRRRSRGWCPRARLPYPHCRRRRAAMDENTIAVGCILGTTFTGQIDEIGAIDKLLADIKQKHGWDIPIHVDAASGGFVAPFVYPELAWDFRLKHVRSINASNHKYGLIYPGMGTVCFATSRSCPRSWSTRSRTWGARCSTTA